MRTLKIVGWILLGLAFLGWGVLMVDSLTPRYADCHCCDFKKDECWTEIFVYGLTALWLAVAGVAARGGLGRWGRWTCAVFWGIAVFPQVVCLLQVGWPGFYLVDAFFATCALMLAFLVSFVYIFLRGFVLKDWRRRIWRLLAFAFVWACIVLSYANGKYGAVLERVNL